MSAKEMSIYTLAGKSLDELKTILNKQYRDYMKESKDVELLKDVRFDRGVSARVYEFMLNPGEDRRIVKDSSTKNGDFEKIVQNYITSLRNIDPDDLDVSMLPARDDSYFEYIMDRLFVEFKNDRAWYKSYMGEIRRELAGLQRGVCEEQSAEVKEQIQFLNEQIEELEDFIAQCDMRIDFIADQRHMDDSLLETAPIKNHLIFIPGNSFGGELPFVKDIESISADSEYYGKVNSILRSLETGVNVNPTRLGEVASRLQEVKRFKVRVLTVHLTGNYYAVIGTFMKKTWHDKDYANKIRTMYKRFCDSEEEILAKLGDPEFMAEQQVILEQVRGRLNVAPTDSITGERGAHNGV